MSDVDPIELIYGGLDQLGPGSDADTRLMLERLPGPVEGEIVDAGCGTGRQTLVLAQSLQRTVHALDNHAPFLEDVERRAANAGLGEYVRTHCMDMADIPARFRDVGLLWSEGAAYSIGFDRALALWRTALRPEGMIVASEITWLEPSAPAEVRAFWDLHYPAMRDDAGNRAAAERAGFLVTGTHVLPRSAWMDGYYGPLEVRSKALLEHDNADVRALAAENLEEIEVFRRAGNSYSYVFYLLQKT
jgi:SAM-dependent methyltransferase